MTRPAPDRAAAAPVAVGIGCRAGSSAEAIEAAIDAALARLAGLSRARIARVATLDAKAGEPGLVACCTRHGWPLVAIAREVVATLCASCDAHADAADADATVAPSAVQARFGVPAVCEPCALAAVPNGWGPARLLVPKTITGGVTVAIAGPPDPFPVLSDSTTR